LFRTGQSARVRADGAVEVIADELNLLRPNGYRVATTDITLALEALPNVREAAAVAAGTAGNTRLSAFVVWQESVGADAALAEARSRVGATWPRAAQPDEWVAVDSLPRTSSGAVDLRRLRTSKNVVTRPDAQSLPAGETEQRIASIWAELLGQPEIDPTANFFELGGHSLLAARMLARVEAQFGRRVTLAALFRAPTIRGLAHLLQHDARDFDFRQMVKLQADGANLPLIAINNTGVYYLLAKRLGTQQPVTSLQVFDPSARHETLPGTLEEIAAEYVQLIQRVHPQGPYVLAGWCVAGALAFEIARQLVAAGQPVRQLFLIDSWVPGYFTRLHPLRRAIGGYSLRWQLASADWRRFTSGQQTFAEFLQQRVLVKRLRALFAPTAPDTASATPAAAAAAQSGQSAAGPEDYDRWLLEYLKATTNRYEPKTYSGRITLFRSTQEPTGWLFDPLAGWGAYAAGGVELALVKGNHFTMFQDPGATQMAAHMSKLIGPAS
jgi:thioesterase domain-containing protein/acyl carrier protein